MSYDMKQSGEKETFPSGAHRDTQKGKIRYDLIPALSLQRVAALYTKGAEHYGEGNWSKGMPFSRFLASLQRHLQQFILRDDEEDHLAAIIFNAMAIMHFQEMGLDKEWDDRERPSCIPDHKCTVDEVVIGGKTYEHRKTIVAGVEGSEGATQDGCASGHSLKSFGEFGEGKCPKPRCDCNPYPDTAGEIEC